MYSFPPFAHDYAYDVIYQFYLGSAGTGAPMHIHGDAINVMAYGFKRWFLYPPSDAFYSNKQASKWYIEDYPLLQNQPFECIQEGGDIMFAPHIWGHATLNLGETIGIAYEFLFPEIPAVLQLNDHTLPPRKRKS